MGLRKSGRGSRWLRACAATMMAVVGVGAVSSSAQDDPAKNDAAKKDSEAIQGTWVMEALEVNGMDVPAEKLKSAVLTIKGNRYELKLKDKVINVFALTLHPGKSPKELDMTAQEGANKDKVHKGIYKIENGKFIFARGLEPEQERPKEFATWPGTSCFVVTWKKQ